MIAQAPADATATLSSLAPVKSRMVRVSGARFPGCPGKRPLDGCSHGDGGGSVIFGESVFQFLDAVGLAAGRASGL